jgi:hypothetical protein
VMLEGKAVSGGNPYPALQRLLNLRAVSMVVHSSRVLFRVAQNLTGRQDDGIPGSRFLSYLFADFIDPCPSLRGKPPFYLALHQASPYLQVTGRFLEIKFPPRPGRIPGNCHQGDEGDQEKGGKDQPDEAYATHALFLEAVADASNRFHIFAGKA